MTYKLFNKSEISRDILHKLIQFACPSGVDNFKISIIKTKSNFSGTAGKTYSDKNQIKIWIGGKLEYPTLSNDKIVEKYGYKPNFVVNNKEEDLISTIAHELRHLWQLSVSQQNFINGKVYNYTHWDNQTYICIPKMESDACEYAYRILKQFRKEMRKVK